MVNQGAKNQNNFGRSCLVLLKCLKFLLRTRKDFLEICMTLYKKDNKYCLYIF